MQPSQSDYKLSDTENHTIFIEQIEPRLSARSLLSDKPIAIFLGGQPGSGKSSLAIYYRQQFAQPGIVIVNSDALREFHPDYSTLQSIHPERASFLVNLDTVIWQRKLIESAKLARKNILLDGTLGGDLEPIKQTIQQFQQVGYVVGISLMAVPAYQSRLGIYQCYHDQVEREGHGRWVGMGTHESVYDQLPDRIDQLEQQQLVDQVSIFTRPVGNQPPNLLYENRLTNGKWAHETRAGQALTTHRNRLLTYAEYKAHKAVIEDVHWQLEQTAQPPETLGEFLTNVEQTTIRHRVATTADARLYFAWANDPITRQQSFNSAPISWEAHEAWFTRKVNDPDALLLVFETSDNVPIGQVRFERSDDELTASIGGLWPETISLSIDAQFRGKGIAAVLLEEACDSLRRKKGPVPVTAYIKLDNAASVRAFERAGFIRQDSGQSDRLRLVKH
ncbi:GNAT family N-acetyltransferase [Fibrella arboris]|uniref:GNAT family N-acetyltransferase n=1 Tax=Fibrella arboris TaxID=3242486 RepID=UPI00352225C9